MHCLDSINLCATTIKAWFHNLSEQFPAYIKLIFTYTFMNIFYI
uniref:Uncharacterized protein n=1 Tax=Anguilla anguilla TaxID=7936 RepID=A0A0E9WJT1_ANGAN